jgi:hypothetical protein
MKSCTQAKNKQQRIEQLQDGMALQLCNCDVLAAEAPYSSAGYNSAIIEQMRQQRRSSFCTFACFTSAVTHSQLCVGKLSLQQSNC